MLALVFALLLGQGPGQAQAAPSFDPATTIAGIVVDSASQAPLGKVLVRITPTIPAGQRRIRYEPPPNRSAITEADGRFAFLNVPPGKYQLSAALPNRNPQLFLSESFSQYSTAITLGTGIDASHLVFPYRNGGSLAGTVADASGEPLQSAQIHLYTNRVVDGQARITSVQQTNVRNHGRFYFGHVPAGTYWVAVSARPWFSDRISRGGARFSPSRGFTTGLPEEPAGSPEMDVGYPLTYYGDTTDFKAATPVSVAENGSANIQITLRTVRNIHVKLTSDARGEGHVYPNVTPVGPDNLPMFGNSTIRADGTISIPPGRYTIQHLPRGGGFTANQIGKIVDLTADGPLDAPKQEAVKVTGTVKVEGDEKPLNDMFIVFINQGRYEATAEVTKSGTFTVAGDNLSPGRYQLGEINTPNFFLKSISAKGASVNGDEIEIASGGNVQLSLTVAPVGSSIVRGVVTHGPARQAAALVLLLPVQTTLTTAVRRDQSDLDGSFELTGMPNGQYRLLAVDDGHDLAYRDPAAIAPYLPKATVLNINGQPLANVTVEVQARQR